MTTERKILIGVSVATVILAVLLISSLFGRGKDPVTHEAVIAAQDETIKAYKSSAEAWQQVAAESRQTVVQLIARDSMLLSNYIDHQKVYPKIDEKLKNIPAYISRIAGNDDSIRAAFARD